MAHYFYINKALKVTPDMTWREFINGTNMQQLRCLAEDKGIDPHIQVPQLRRQLQEELKSHHATLLCYYNLYGHKMFNTASNATKDKQCTKCSCIYSWQCKEGTRARDYNEQAQEEQKKKKDRKIKKYEVAELVKAKCEGWEQYVKGIVTKDNGDDTYVIDFENEKKEDVKEMEMIKIQPGRWIIRKTPTVITEKEEFDKLQHDYYFHDEIGSKRSDKYPFNVKEEKIREEHYLGNKLTRCTICGCETFTNVKPLIKSESLRTFYDEGQLVQNSRPNSNEMTLEEIVTKPLNITTKRAKLNQGSFKKDLSYQRVRGSRDCIVQPPLKRLIKSIRLMLTESGYEYDYDKIDKGDDRDERTLCENCRCGKASCRKGKFPCHYFVDGREVCAGTATKCSVCHNVFALCHFSCWINHCNVYATSKTSKGNHVNMVTEEGWQRKLENGEAVCSRCFLKNFKEHKTCFNNSTDKLVPRLKKTIKKMKKKKSKNEWKRRCEEEAQKKKECLKHQWDHLDWFFKNQCLKIADAKINSDKFEGIPVTQTREQIAMAIMARVEGNSSITYEEYYQQNIQAKEEEKEEEEKKRKTLLEAKVNFHRDMTLWKAEKENNFLKDYEGDKDDSIAVQKEVLKRICVTVDKNVKEMEESYKANRKNLDKLLKKCHDNPLKMTKEDSERIKSLYKKVTKNDIEFERRGDNIFVEIITKKRKRADDYVTQNVLPNRGKAKAAKECSKSTQKKYPDSVDVSHGSTTNAGNAFEPFSDLKNVQKFPPLNSTKNDVSSDEDEEERDACGTHTDDDDFEGGSASSLW